MTLAERAEALRHVPLFAPLSRRGLQQIARMAAEVTVPPGQVFIEPNSKGLGLFVILEGTATVRGRATRVELGPGEVVGELALLTREGIRKARVQAKTELRCVAVARPDFRRLLEQEPKLAIALLEVVAERLAAHV